MDICHHNDVPMINENISMTNDMHLRLTLFYDNQRIYIHPNNYDIRIIFRISIYSAYIKYGRSYLAMVAMINENSHKQ